MTTPKRAALCLEALVMGRLKIEIPEDFWSGVNGLPDRLHSKKRELQMTQRMGRLIGINPEAIERYKELHASPWPDTIEKLKERNIQNFSIFLREPENLLFSYWEYTGNDFETDFARNKEDPRTREWWKITAPLQRPLDSCKKNDWWSPMEEVFHAK